MAQVFVSLMISRTVAQDTPPTTDAPKATIISHAQAWDIMRITARLTTPPGALMGPASEWEFLQRGRSLRRMRAPCA